MLLYSCIEFTCRVLRLLQKQSACAASGGQGPTCAPGCAIGCNQYTSLSLESSHASNRSCLVPKEYSVGARQSSAQTQTRCPQSPQPPRVQHQQAMPFGWSCHECALSSSALTPDYQNYQNSQNQGNALEGLVGPASGSRSGSAASTAPPPPPPEARQCCPMRSACGDYFWSCTAELAAERPSSSSSSEWVRDRDLSELRLVVSEPTPDACIDLSWTLPNRSDAASARVRLYELDIHIWRADAPAGEASAPWTPLSLVCPPRSLVHFVRDHVCTSLSSSLQLYEHSLV